MSRRGEVVSLLLASIASGCGYYGFESRDRDPIVVVDAGTDGGTDAAMPFDCASRPTALVCSTFDTLDGFARTYPPTNGTIGIANGVLRAETTADGGSAVVDATFGPLTSGTLHFRTHVRIVGAYPIVDVNTFQLGDRASPDTGIDFDFVNGGYARINASGAIGTDSSTTTMPRDRWLCLDGTVVVADAGSIELRIDGEPTIALTNADTLPTNGMRQLLLGIEWSHATQASAVIEYDDFVIDTVPITCP